MPPKSILKKRPAPVRDDDVVEVPVEDAVGPTTTIPAVPAAVAALESEDDDSDEAMGGDEEDFDAGSDDDDEVDTDEDEEAIRALAEGQPRPAKSASCDGR